MRTIHVSDFEMPVCPLCDNGLHSLELVEVAQTPRGSLALVHTACLDEAEPNESDDVKKFEDDMHGGQYDNEK